MKFLLKILDKFLGKLKTDRNTFFTYIFTLITAYMVVDRIMELIFLCSTGSSVTYWGPITYTFALVCPLFAYSFAQSSKFSKSNQTKISFFYGFWVAFYIIAISMFIQWINKISWVGLFSLPNANTFFEKFSNVTKRAFSLIPIYIILMTFYKLFFWLYKTINDPIFPNQFKDSILDFPGLDISSTPENSGPYSFEIDLCKDKDTGKSVKLLEKKRFDNTLIVGPSGTGKTSLVMEPLIAKDLEKKYFLRESSKELGYSALKNGLAYLNCPYDNTYLNQNFSLNMLVPAEGKEKAYLSHVKKLIYGTAPDGTIVYKNLGMTVLTPEYEQVYKIAEIAKNFGIPTHIIDPLDSNSIGLNPFSMSSPAVASLLTALVLQELYESTRFPTKLSILKDISFQALQNVFMFLAEMYPRRHDGDLPTLEDLMHCLINFDLVEELCEDLKTQPDLVEKYEFQIAYFEQHFYKNSPGRKDLQLNIHFITSQLELILKKDAVRNIICRRNNNLDYNALFNNGEIVLICTRPSDIGGAAHKAFALFFLNLFMYGAEGRPGTEKTMIPHFLYIDEFDIYSTPVLGSIFTLYRKFKIGSIISTQSLSNLGGTSDPFVQSILSNSPTKITFGNCTPEEYAWWEQEFGKRREWKAHNSYTPDKIDGIDWDWKSIMSVAKIQGLAFKSCIYKTKNKKGKNIVNYGMLDFLESKYNEPHKIKTYSFDKFNKGTKAEEKKSKKQKFNPDNIDFDNDDKEIDPVQTDVTDSSFLFDNENAVSFDLKGNKK